MLLEKNPHFYTSVHLCGAAGTKEKEEDERAAAELWKSKVVVDSLDFKVGGFTTRDKPLQSSKTDDILKGPVSNKALKIVRNARLPSGKKVTFSVPFENGKQNSLKSIFFFFFCRFRFDLLHFQYLAAKSMMIRKTLQLIFVEVNSLLEFLYL